MKQRVFRLTIIFVICFVVLLGRLFVLMIFPDGLSFFRSNSVKDRRVWPVQLREREELEHLVTRFMDDGRGQILFGNGKSWSEQLVGLVPQVLQRELPKYKKKQTFNAVVGQVGRTDHWPIQGKVLPEQGRSGLEATFDTVLASKQPGYIGTLVDAKNQIVIGRSPFIQLPKRGENVRTTIDSAWQNETQSLLSKAHVINGAIVVLRIQDNSILAMASKSPDDENTAVMSATPGSIFKLVTAAAALETQQTRLHDIFYCPGFVPLQGVHMHCWAIHGKENFISALAVSCDTVFAEMAVHLGRIPLQTLSERLGLSSSGLQMWNGQSVLPEAQQGSVLIAHGNDPGLLANTGIGQQDVRLSPLQAALLCSTIANVGWYRPARLVADLEQHQQADVILPRGVWHRAFSRYTAECIKMAMQEVVSNLHGTAHDLSAYDVAAKTGTAELYGTKAVNGWLVGFSPVQHPRFAFAIEVKKAPSSLAHQQIHQIGRELLYWSRQYLQGKNIG